MAFLRSKHTAPLMLAKLGQHEMDHQLAPGAVLEVPDEYAVALAEHAPSLLLIDAELFEVLLEAPPEPQEPAAEDDDDESPAVVPGPSPIQPQNLRDFTVSKARPLVEETSDAEVLRVWFERDDRKGIHDLITERLAELEGDEEG